MKRTRYSSDYISCLPSVPIPLAKQNQIPNIQAKSVNISAINLTKINQQTQVDTKHISQKNLNKKCLIKFDNRSDFNFLDLSSIFNEFSTLGTTGCSFSFLKKIKFYIEELYQQRVLAFHWISNMKQGSEAIKIGINSDSELFEVLSIKDLSERLIQVTVAPSYII